VRGKGNGVAVWIVTCPCCGHRGPLGEFDCSLADECWCPKCDAAFMFGLGGDEDDEEDLGDGQNA
jgi:hypothetical protein